MITLSWRSQSGQGARRFERNESPGQRHGPAWRAATRISPRRAKSLADFRLHDQRQTGSVARSNHRTGSLARVARFLAPIVNEMWREEDEKPFERVWFG